jgi:hypothetical protein
MPSIASLRAAAVQLFQSTQNDEVRALAEIVRDLCSECETIGSKANKAADDAALREKGVGGK